MDILDVITDYFGVGGLFNPELMEHDKVSNMVEMARAEITSLRAELAKKPVLLVHGFYSTNTNKYYLDESDAVKAGNAYAVYTATPPKE